VVDESDQIVTLPLPRVVAHGRLWLRHRLLWRRSLLPLTVSVILRHGRRRRGI
jgi:hypothetical protein